MKTTFAELNIDKLYEAALEQYTSSDVEIGDDGSLRISDDFSVSISFSSLENSLEYNTGLAFSESIGIERLIAFADEYNRSYLVGTCIVLRGNGEIEEDQELCVLISHVNTFDDELEFQTKTIFAILKNLVKTVRIAIDKLMESADRVLD